MIALRWLAMAIAIATIWDPAIRLSQSRRPAVEITVTAPAQPIDAADHARGDLERELIRAGFDPHSGAEPAARLLIANRPPERIDDRPTWIVDISDRQTPNVRIVRASVTPVRAPGQAAEVHVVVEGRGVQGQTTEVLLEQQGIPVASIKHVWGTAAESWPASLHYRPPSDEAATLSVRAVPLPSESSGADNTADVRLPAVRRPVRVLAYDSSVSWPATFVRRSLEASPAFAVSARQQPAPGVAARAGAPPDLLSASTLSGFDVAVIGEPEALSAREVDALRSFVEDRGGIAVLIAARRPSGPYASLVGVEGFDARTTEDPVRLSASHEMSLRASELFVARGLPKGAQALATIGSAAEPVIFAARRGEGAIVFSGALDAWRYRDADNQSFSRFWRTALSELGVSVPRRLSVDVEPSFARAGDRIRIRARLRAAGASIVARVVAPAQHIDAPVRLWPTVEPGTFEGEWTIPAPGVYDVSVSSVDARADASVLAVRELARSVDDDAEGLALLAAATGGDVRPPDQIASLVAALGARFPSRPTSTSIHPMRSPWWIVPFALALCAEWGWRRMRGER